MNKKRLAIENFKRQISELDKLNYAGSFDAWKSYSREAIIRYLGSDSEFLGSFIGAYSLFTDIRYFKEDVQQAKEILTQCIQYIELNGLREESKQNFLYRLSETALWTLLSVGIPGLLGIGVFFGNLSSDKQNIELRQENKALKDSLTLIRSIAKPADTVPNSQTQVVHKQPETKKQKH